MKSAIIMAAGKGTRMKSEKPKCLHKVCDKTMIEHLIDTSKEAGAQKVVTIVGYGRDEMMSALDGKCEFAIQDPQLGTGHAVMQAEQCEKEKGQTIVINGDCPCVQKEVMQQLYHEVEKVAMAVLTVVTEDPKSYGRVVRGKDGFIERIVEFKDCTEAEKKICEINTGIYGFDNEILFSNLKEIKNNNQQQEYYITDLVEILNQKGCQVSAIQATSAQEVAGVNDQGELAQANQFMKKIINEKWMDMGVVMLDPNTTYIGADVILEAGVVLYPQTVLHGKTKISKGTTIYSQCYFNNAIIGENCNIYSSQIIDSEVKEECNVGPYAHFRGHSVVEAKNRVGNFVEFKNTHFGYDSRCAHLTYLGDSEVGSGVNIGCGVVTVNYDGKNKFKTVIEDGAFIGSNSNLIAPITVGKRAVVAAGSTVTQDIHEGDMAIARSRQENKPGYGSKYKDK
ncbi:MAG: bifunctional UDP-N-acetylglucosamine diphosphorylase/glucosamine-1-phosphate N-acetyltransferase GlmU [Anaerorhabdus sp.]